MLSESPKVKVSPESSKDSVLNTYKRNLIEVTEKSVASEDGIPLELDSPLPEPVN